AEGQDVDVGGADVVHRLLDFLVGFTQAQHDAGLGQGLGRVGLGMGKDVQCLVVAGTRVAHDMGQALDGLDVLGKGGQARVQDFFHAAVVAAEVGGQGFDGGLGRTFVD